MDPTALQLTSLDGGSIQVVGGEWKEVKTNESEQFQQEALVEVYRRGVETAGQVCAVSDGADWIPKFVDYR
jgi:hypothetical protein